MNPYLKGYADAWADRPRSLRSKAYLAGYEEGRAERTRWIQRTPQRRRALPKPKRDR